MPSSSALHSANRNKSRLFPLLACLGLNLLVGNSHAGLTSSYTYDVSNTFVSVDGQLNGPPQPVVSRDGGETSSRGNLVSFEGDPLGIGVGAGVDGGGTVGPSPTVRARAEATGRDFRVDAGLEFGSQTCPTPNCIFVDASATWQLRWNARAATLSEDTIVIDVPGFDGLAGEFTIPIDITGSNAAESNLLAPTLPSETGFTVATADANGVRTASDSFRYFASNRAGGSPAGVIDTQADFVVPFVVGEEFSLVAAFFTDVSVLTPSILTQGLVSILVEGDFFNTAHFDPFENFRLDSSGDGLFDIALDTSLLSLSSQLNVDYLALGGENGGGDMGGGDPVPPPVSVLEPSTIWLSALGCLALLRIRRRGSYPSASASAANTSGCVAPNSRRITGKPRAISSSA